ncbi:MAG: bifunctional phosphoribosyl-AMP cyclohydrolase/phosphoribosyl-ATP diphosphatase HisIE [Lachnospiraceae bacterium]|jgi:phosphoribosyl-ATP pyrophosphohydrolase/phosphoribosyl-AMP cyclohydrolase|nr:bifunctional phosphoribosyl-AMP cyclohydrolase/phosphoribosyl-ATP diphosphatase HisIE [Lachnospiraceae bacterium]MCI9133883.1 bifunctional phosphoribosyl-AMP cyclohydrolase/phosphoribosyl-ATP diphosphatase HisIE [Lachnospiraceae bacterium]
MTKQLNTGCIRLSQGLTEDKKDPVALAGYYSDNGADEILVFDLSHSEEEHEKNLGVLKEIVRTVEVPVKAAGHIQRLEDVKKILYTGCSKAILNYGKQSNIDLTEEVSRRFGKEKIAAAVNSSDVVSAPAALVEEYVSELIYLNELAPFEEKLRPLDCNMEWSEFKLNSDGMVPVIVQDYRSDQVLMAAYMNEEAYTATLKTGRMTYWSRSRQELWVKGATSGHFQYVKELLVDCDYDTILARVSQTGAACHTGNRSCFFQDIARRETKSYAPGKVFEQVYQVIADRKSHPKEGSYTNYLFDKGIDKILKKVGEEAAELIIAAKNPDPEEIKYEMSDLLYHAMVLMVERGVTWEDITRELSNR